EALADLGDARAIGPIAGLLKDPVADVKRNALGALSHFDEGVPTAPVVALLDDPNADVRHEAIDLLDHLHARSAAGAIARMIHDPSPDVRHAAVSTLGNMGAQGAVGAVTEALADANADVRQAALGALNDLKAPIAEPTLLNLMKDPAADVRQRAAELAGERSLVTAIPGLRRFSDAPTRIQGAKDSLAGSVTDPRALTLLAATLGTDNPCVRRVAAKLLGRSAVSAAVLRELLADPSPRIRESAAFASGVGERREIRAALEHLLADTSTGPATMAAWALGEIHDPASAPALQGAVHAASPRLRLA